jgi:hypothetical protein
MLAAFHQHGERTWTCCVDEFSSNANLYDLIIVIELVYEIGIDICFSEAEMIW